MAMEPQVMQPATVTTLPAAGMQQTMSYTGAAMAAPPMVMGAPQPMPMGAPMPGMASGMTMQPQMAAAPTVLNAAFNALDRNHDGVITRSEFNAAMR